MFTGRLPEPSAPHPYGDKLHQQFQRSRSTLEHILAGYCLPQPYYQEKMDETVQSLMKALRDPMLPLLELQVSTSLVTSLYWAVISLQGEDERYSTV